MGRVSYLFYSLCLLGAFTNYASSTFTNMEVYFKCNCYERTLFLKKLVTHLCMNCELYEVPQNLSTDVQALWLGDNQIETILNTTFENYKQLRNLELANNSITTIQEGSFEYLYNLKYLDLSNNNLLKVFDQKFSSLYVIFLDFCNALNYFRIRDTKVEQVILNSTPLNEFPVIQSRNSLKRLDISNTKIAAPITVDYIAQYCNLAIFSFDPKFSTDLDCVLVQKWLKNENIQHNEFKCSGANYTEKELTFSNNTWLVKKQCIEQGEN